MPLDFQINIKGKDGFFKMTINSREYEGMVDAAHWEKFDEIYEKSHGKALNFLKQKARKIERIKKRK